MRILIATVQVPFILGGAELHAKGLRSALIAHGHEAEIVTIPFNTRSPGQILESIRFARQIDLTEISRVRVDTLIGLKFPAYLIRHPNKVLWVLHQYRAAYDLWDKTKSFPGLGVVRAIRQADTRFIPEARVIYANSLNVSRRLKEYCDIDSTPLYHPPPNEERFFPGTPHDYLLFPSRVNRLKRQELALKALTHTRHAVRLIFVGQADECRYGQDLRRLASELQIQNRVQWMGRVTDEEKIQLYAHCLGVVYPPQDEDYGYVTLESMLASKPVITCTDSGGTLEFVRHGETGIVVEATPEELAKAMDELWQDRIRAQNLGARGLAVYKGLGLSWSNVVDRLLRKNLQ
jgi:glycosyltransferase involved in cell wall biosynthesis